MRAETSYDTGEGGSAEELVFLESHQDKRNSTPATRSGKPSRDQSMLETRHWPLRPKPLPSTKQARTINIPASHSRHQDTKQPTSAIPKDTRKRISVPSSCRKVRLIDNARKKNIVTPSPMIRATHLIPFAKLCRLVADNDSLLTLSCNL